MCGVRRTWELPHLGSVSNKSYCVSNGYCSSRHCARHFRVHPGNLHNLRWLQGCLTDFVSCCSPLNLFCSGNPGFLAVSLTYHVYSQLKTFKPAVLSACKVLPQACFLISIKSVLKCHFPVQSFLTIPSEITTSPTTTSLSVFLPFIIHPDCIF